MKTILIFPLILLTPFSSRLVIQPKGNPFETITVSPLYYDKETTFIIYTKVALLQIRVFISNDVFDNQKIIETTFTRSGKHILKYNNQYTRSVNEIQVAYKNTRTWVTSDVVTMRVMSESYRNVVDNQGFSSSNYVNVLSYSTLRWTSHKVNYQFTNFDGLYIPDYYHKIKLDEFSISVDSADLDLFKCTPSLVLTNVNGAFNDISTNQSVEIELKTKKTSTGLTFELKDILYVHKETLLMSKTQKDGYVPTKHIYLPRNDMKNQGKYKAYFALQDFGIDHDFVRHNFEMHALKNIVGDCQNSEYCIQRL